MITTAKSLMKTLDAEDLSQIARQKGPCVTIQIPDVRPGAASGSRLSYLKQLTHEAAQGLRNLHRSPHVEDLVHTLERLTGLLEKDQGGPGVAVLAAPGWEAIYQTPGASTERFTIASRFHILPFLPTALAPQDFYILGISEKHVRLWRYSHGHCEEQPLPASVPPNLEAAGAFDQPDHDLENRSASGPSTGSMRRVRFGTSTDREAGGEYLHHFFALIHKGLKETLNGLPLLLVGVREELAAYRRAAKQARIFQSEWHANPQLCSLPEVQAHARDAALDEYHRAGQQALASLDEVREKILGEPERTLAAAAEGRVRSVFVAQGARAPASPDQADAQGLYPGEDLLNAAAVETLRTSGEVFTIPGESLPGMVPIAAMLRY
jgi:Bacterial archaeo-eukaryotic release factor family 3